MDPKVHHGGLQCSLTARRSVFRIADESKLLRRTYSAYVRPGLQVFDGFGGQLLFVQLSVDLRQLGHPETIAVLPEDLPDAALDLLRVVGRPLVWVLIKIQGCYRAIGKFKQNKNQ